MLAMTQGTIWNILGIIGLTPWTQDFFFYFLGPCLLATSCNTGWIDIREIFKILTQDAICYTISRLSRLFHALQTRHGGSLRSRCASCFLGVFFSLFKTVVFYRISRLYFKYIGGAELQRPLWNSKNLTGALTEPKYRQIDGVLVTPSWPVCQNRWENKRIRWICCVTLVIKHIWHLNDCGAVYC